MEDVLEDLSDTQPGLPAGRQGGPAWTYDSYEKGLQEVALKVNPPSRPSATTATRTAQGH